MRRSAPSYSLLLPAAIAALAIAVCLVMYAQRRSYAEQRDYSMQLLQQACERTALVVAAQVRRLFDGAVIEIIQGLGEPETDDGQIPRVAVLFETGLKRFPYVSQFFLWKRNAALSSAPILFYQPPAFVEAGSTVIIAPNGQSMGALVPDDAIGEEVISIAQEAQAYRSSFVVLERDLGGRPHQIVLRYVWEDSQRTRHSAIIGYTVDLERVRAKLFDQLVQTELKSVLDADPENARFVLTVLDDEGRIVSGPVVPPSVPSAIARVDVLFFPAEPLHSWLGARPTPMRWRLVVSAPTAPPIAAADTWLSAAVIVLILLALYCAVKVNRDAIRLARSQADFVANVSHQLKTPLAVLSAMSETLGLERVRSPEKVKQYVEVIRGQTVRLSGLVERVLEFSRVDTAARPYSFQPVRLTPLVERLVQEFTSRTPELTVPIRFESEPDLPMVKADPLAMEQVILNLLENAARYSKEGREVEVRLFAAAGSIVLAVRDYGVGISPADLPHIFDRFYRGHHEEDRPKGFGLGLTIVRTIVEAHRGTVVVNSELGRGAHFNVAIPVLVAET